MTDRSLRSFFLDAAERFPARPALEVAGETFTYEALKRRAAALAATLNRHTPAGGPPLVTVLAYRSPTAFAGVLGALFSGAGYVPVHRVFPVERNRRIFQAAGTRAVIVDAASEGQLEALLADAPEPLLVIAPDSRETGALQARLPGHRVLGAAELEPAEAWTPGPVSPDAIAYLLFTSGSTGQPKGVMVAQRNVLPLVDFMLARYGVGPEDRASQTFDMTFDLSVHDLFVTWGGGACLCCPSQKTLLKPDRFIQASRLTLWYSVPSMAAFLKRMGLLTPGRFPTLRASLFCGEPLPVEIARAWQVACPGSVVDNLYGPTEMTISCLYYRHGPQTEAEAHLGVVPIGWPHPQMEVLVADEQQREVPPGADGELLMSGVQVTPGYWKDPEKTAAAFVVPPGRTEIFYRTGDRVRRPVGDAPLTYLGRTDHQIKVQGHRVELGEVETAVRQATGLDLVVAVGWPLSERGAEAIEVFLCGEAMDLAPIRLDLAARLPGYMLPRAFHFLPAFPVNANGKVDRKALAARLAAAPSEGTP